MRVSNSLNTQPELLNSLDNLAARRATWEAVLARPEQLPTTDNEWSVWLYLAGRGAGKTRTAAEWIVWQALTQNWTRWAVIAPTFGDVRDTCAEGESGLIPILHQYGALEYYNRSTGDIKLTNGSRIKLFSADEPDRLRGPQHHGAWCDELAAWRYPETYDQLQFGLRLGEHPKTVITTTPRPIPLIRQLTAKTDGTVRVVRGSTFDNAANLAPSALVELQARYNGTRLGRQELYGEILDDVEGASRGDLTVQAEVSPDELGAVADAFNLTIQNLREIVQQVKRAAKQVNKNSIDSESFARNNSSDALRMAEELAVTLNSVQLMTESIQRVAENAHEAEEVAHTSSVTALKGGEAVERTVGGILQIRETVSETARKVKRLAEASQEISKIVAVISQIASRTNLLALNASIQAARAGEAGRGFAIVADEVRQLADRSAKSLKEIEQIVLQIQSETGAVMTAMEEGIQQVIDVTDKSEQSKRALEDIIEVSNRINTLVRSISGDTVRQQENSGAVAQVMQSIELIAQETSQESQRVAGSLQTLVSISKDLLTSVERFRVEKNSP